MLFSDVGAFSDDPRGPWCYIHVSTAFANDFFTYRAAARSYSGVGSVIQGDLLVICRIFIICFKGYFE